MVQNVVIMAGGAGKRLWPASSENVPKQFLRVGGDKTLFAGTLQRAFELGVSGNVYVVTHENHVEAAVQECRVFSREERTRIVILAEPVARNTAPALAFVGAFLRLEGRGEETSLIMAADHLISPLDQFRTSVEAASNLAEQGFVVPYGIVPQNPATGYGYIEIGEEDGKGYKVKTFREKPDLPKAREYAASGRHFWNAGIFTYRGSVFVNELEAHAPDVWTAFKNLKTEWFCTRKEEGVTIHEAQTSLRREYETVPSISVDYAVMEKTGRIRMVKAAFNWNDVGSWDVVSEIGMPSTAPVYSIESSGNFVYADRPVALCGVKDLIVVEDNGKILICHKEMSQLVKNAAQKDAEENSKQKG